eukprot:g4973.t1
MATPTVEAFLKRLELEEYAPIIYDELGKTMRDLQELDQDDMASFKAKGMPKGPFRRLLRAVSSFSEEAGKAEGGGGGGGGGEEGAGAPASEAAGGGGGGGGGNGVGAGDVDGNWAQVSDPNTGATYWWNAQTGETSWSRPSEPAQPARQPSEKAAASQKPSGPDEANEKPILVTDGQIIAGRFKVLLNEQGVLGPKVSSGNSAVYVAADLERGHKKAALKFMRVSSGEYLRERAFYQYCGAQPGCRECMAELLAAIDEFQDENTNELSILALEHGAGNAAELCNDPNLTDLERQRWAIEIVKCTAFLHARCGVVWGDLKPENFIICGTALRQQLKMIDFTDAAVVPGTLDGEGRLVNKESGRVYAETGVVRDTFGPDDKMTPSFMPPERLYHCVLMRQTIPASPKMDMWSLGVLACDMFSGDSLSDEALFSNADGDERRNALLKDLGNLSDAKACQAAEAKLRDMVSVRLAKASSSWRHAIVERLLVADPACRESASTLMKHASLHGGAGTVSATRILEGIEGVSEKVDEAIDTVIEGVEDINDEMQLRMTRARPAGGGVLGAAAGAPSAAEVATPRGVSSAAGPTSLAGLAAAVGEAVETLAALPDMDFDALLAETKVSALMRGNIREERDQNRKEIAEVERKKKYAAAQNAQRQRYLRQVQQEREGNVISMSAVSVESLTSMKAASTEKAKDEDKKKRAAAAAEAAAKQEQEGQEKQEEAKRKAAEAAEQEKQRQAEKAAAAAAEVAEGEGKQGGGGDGDNINSDREALLTFFEAMGGEKGYLGGKVGTWTATWDLSQPVDKWDGVECDAASGRVVKISSSKWSQSLLEGLFPNLDLYKCWGITGDLSKVQWPAALQSLNMPECEGIEGDLSKVQWPAALQFFSLHHCRKVQAPAGCPKQDSYGNYNDSGTILIYDSKEACDKLREWIASQ